MGNHIENQSRGDNENNEVARKNQRSEKVENKNELVEVDLDYYKEIS